MTISSYHAILNAYHEYGNVVQISPNTVLFTDPSAWPDIYRCRAVLPEDPAFFNKMLLDRKTGTMGSDDEAVPIRRAMNPGFLHKALLAQEPMSQGHVDRLSVDIHKYLTFSMFDMDSDFAFGENLGFVKCENKCSKK